MLDKSINGYTEAAINRVIQARDGVPIYVYRADLLDLDNVLLFSLGGLQSGKGQAGHIAHDTFQPLKRGAELHFLRTLRDAQHTAPLGTFAATILAQSRLFWLRCNEASGNFLDSSGNNRTFTANGTFAYSVGSLTLGDPLNNAVSPNGTTGYMSIADAAWMDVSQITLTIAYKGTGATDTLIDRDDGGSNRFWRLEIDADGNVAFSITFTSGSPARKTFTASGAVNDGFEHLIAASYDGAHVEIYVDGKRLLKTAETRTMTTGTLAINIGRNNAAANFLSGTVDEIGMLGRVPSPKERRDEFQAWSARAEEVLLDRDRGDRVRIYAGVRMPTAGTDGSFVAEWPQITAVLTSPEENYEPTGRLIRVTCQDQTRILQDAAFATVTTLAAGANYLTGPFGVLAIAAAAGFNTAGWAVTATVLVAPADIPFEIGSTFLDAINYLLTSINYKPLRFNGDGAAVLEPNKLDVDLPVSDTLDSRNMIVIDGMVQSSVISARQLSRRLEPRKVVNTVNVFNASPDVIPIIEVAINTNARSASSTVFNAPKIRGFQIDVPDAPTAENIAIQILSDETARTAERLVFDTLPRPFHSDRDRFRLVLLAEFGIDADYVEEGWTLPLDPTQLMSHTVLSVVDVR